MQNALIKVYPKPKRQRRQLYFSENAWKILCQRKDVRSQCRQLQQSMKRHVLKSLFACWSLKVRGEASNESSGFENCRYHRHMYRLQLAWTYEQRARLDALFQKQKRDDWKDWVEKQTSEQLARAQHAKGADIYKIFKPKEAIAKHVGKGRRALPGFKDGQGQWVRFLETLPSHGRINSANWNMQLIWNLTTCSPREARIFQFGIPRSFSMCQRFLNWSEHCTG